MYEFLNYFGGQADKENVAARQRQDVTAPDDQQRSGAVKLKWIKHSSELIAIPCRNKTLLAALNDVRMQFVFKINTYL